MAIIQNNVYGRKMLRTSLNIGYSGSFRVVLAQVIKTEVDNTTGDEI